MKSMNIFVATNSVKRLLLMQRTRNFTDLSTMVWKETTTNVIFVANILQQHPRKESMKHVNIYVISVKRHSTMQMAKKVMNW